MAAGILLPNQPATTGRPANRAASDISKRIFSNNHHRIAKAIKNGGGSTLTDIEIFDVYTGVGVGLDKKSMAYSLTFSDNKKTLTDEEVNSLMEKIIDTVSKKCGAELRK